VEYELHAVGSFDIVVHSNKGREWENNFDLSTIDEETSTNPQKRVSL
jgi:hypothetical protein